MPDWIEPDDVAMFLGEPLVALDGDGNVTLATAAWRAAVERRHPQYFTDDTPAVYSPPPDIRAGAIRAAAMTYNARVSPTSGDEGGMWDSLGGTRREIMRQLRWDLPVAF